MALTLRCCGGAQEGGAEGQKRLEFWWDCLQDGTLPADQHPVGWDFKSGGLPLCPPWAKGAAVGVKAPEGGFGPGANSLTAVYHRCVRWLTHCWLLMLLAAPPETHSHQNPNANGGVAETVALRRQMGAF